MVNSIGNRRFRLRSQSTSFLMKPGAPSLGGGMFSVDSDDASSFPFGTLVRFFVFMDWAGEYRGRTSHHRDFTGIYNPPDARDLTIMLVLMGFGRGTYASGVRAKYLPEARSLLGRWQHCVSQYAEASHAVENATSIAIFDRTPMLAESLRADPHHIADGTCWRMDSLGACCTLWQRGQQHGPLNIAKVRFLVQDDSVTRVAVCGCWI